MPHSNLTPLRRIRGGGRQAASLFVGAAVIGVAMVGGQVQPDDALPPSVALSSAAPVPTEPASPRAVYDEPSPIATPFDSLILLPQADVIVPPTRPSPRPGSSPSPTPSAESAHATPSPSTASQGVAPGTASPTPSSTHGGSTVSVDPRVGDDFILISRSRLVSLPTGGAAWDQLLTTANDSAGNPNLADNDQDNNVRVLAKALVFARTGDGRYRAEVIAQLKQAIGTEGVDTLALGRNLAAYALAADFIDLGGVDPQFDQGVFRPWLRSLLALRLDGKTLGETHEGRANNWGTHAGASRAAVAAYLGDAGELARAAVVFRGWLGDRAAYAGFSYGDLSWQSDRSKPVGINPPGATIDGHDVDGVLPDDQRRTGDFSWPPPCGNYPHGALDGALLMAEILARTGYPAYEWSDRALLRAASWLRDTGCPPTGDNVWQLPLLDARYGTSWWNGAAVRPGKNFGWTDWLYGS